MEEIIENDNSNIDINLSIGLKKYFIKPFNYIEYIYFEINYCTYLIFNILIFYYNNIFILSNMVFNKYKNLFLFSLFIHNYKLNYYQVFSFFYKIIFL